MKAQLLVPAAGIGTRLGAEVPKALTEIEGKPLLVRTLERAAIPECLSPAVITIPPESREAFDAALRAWFPAHAYHLAAGGRERQHSVANGLVALDADTEIVIIHDAARPFVPVEAVRASVEAAIAYGAATVAIPVTDTILEGDDAAFLERTPERRKLWACQTPQTFRVTVIREAHARAARDDMLLTDDASLVRAYGGKVKLVLGSPLNFKITTPADLQLARLIIREGLT